MYRGSNSADASAYKKAGHANEDEFGSIVGGTNKGLPAQGKTDWRDDSGTTFSVKQGYSTVGQKWTKHWQVFLYGLQRMRSDAGFMAMGEIGALLTKLLLSFPENQDKYFADKALVKEILSRIPSSVKGEGRAQIAESEAAPDNEYIQSKLKLAKVTLELSEKLRQKDKLADFLRKAMFNGNEVEHLAVAFKGKFLIFPREVVISVFVDAFEVDVSRAGAIKSDLNIAGQKVIMKSGVNIVELEVRNEPNHYRELRFNMRARKAIEILLSGTRLAKTSHGGKVEWYELIN